ncbi:MAG: DUF4833 domain-containing protein [Thermoanaerobaculales bacterium]
MVSTSRSARTALCALILAVVSDAAQDAAPTDPNRLFVIERSVNANVVVYDAVRDGRGRLDPAHPVEVYWLLNADKGQREDLNLIEKAKAYGVEVGASTRDGAQITVKALKDRPIRVRIKGNRPEAIVRIAGHDALLRKVFIQTDSDHPLSVRYVDLLGVSLRGNASVRERISTAG